MNCKNAVKALPEYLDLTLGKDEALGVRDHLALCPECREEARLFSSSWEMLDVLETVQSSAYFRAHFWERVREQETRAWGRTGLFSRFPLAPALAGFFVLWLLGVAEGAHLFKLRHQTVTTTEIALNRFLSPYPQNSVERIFQEGRTPGGNV